MKEISYYERNGLTVYIEYFDDNDNLVSTSGDKLKVWKSKSGFDWNKNGIKDLKKVIIEDYVIFENGWCLLPSEKEDKDLKKLEFVKNKIGIIDDKDNEKCCEICEDYVLTRSKKLSKQK